jgi:hypothetical protein
VNCVHLLVDSDACYRLQFAYHSDPNGDAPQGTSNTGEAGGTSIRDVHWPRYGSKGERNSMHMQGSGRKIIRDDFRDPAIAFLISRPEEFGY